MPGVGAAHDDDVESLVDPDRAWDSMRRANRCCSVMTRTVVELGEGPIRGVRSGQLSAGSASDVRESLRSDASQFFHRHLICPALWFGS